MKDVSGNLPVKSATRRLQILWSMGVAPDLRDVLGTHSSWTAADLSTILRVDQRERWKAGNKKLVEAYLLEFPLVTEDQDALVDLVYNEYLLRKRLGHDFSCDLFVKRFPSLAETLLAQFQLDAMAGSSPSDHQSPSGVTDEEITEQYDTRPAPSPHSNQIPDDGEAVRGSGDLGAVPRKPRLFGRFQLDRRLGQGGMGVVWEAEDLTTRRRVAVKLLNPGRANSQEATDQFLREGQQAAAFSHPRSAFTLEAGYQDGQPYLVMELMPGNTLKELVIEKGALTTSAAIDLIIDVIDGVAAAHQAGILHRDIKPSNCFLDADGQAKIGDFGLALPLTDPSRGSFSGTLAFASPEQIRCERMDERGDQYSIGATLFYLLAKRPPFMGNATSLIAQVAADRAPLLSTLVPDLPVGLDRIVAKTIEKDPALRFKDLRSLRRALLPYSKSGTTAAHIGRRISAYFIDELATIVMVTMGIIPLFILVSMTTDEPLRADNYSTSVYITSVISAFLGVTLAVGYYFFLESIWGAGIGKLIMGLRVVDADGGLPGFRKIALRSWMLPAAGGLILIDPFAIVFNGLVAAPLIYDPTASMLGAMSITSISKVFQFLCLTSMRRKNDFRGWHEYVSQTHVVALRPSTETFAVAQATPRLTKPTMIPQSVGPYLILGTLIDCPKYVLCEAHDPLLKRTVWIHFQSKTLPPLISSLQRIGRPTRLRWLQGGEFEELSWNAYETCTLKDLSSIVSSGEPVDWEFARRVLLDLSEELSQAESEGTLPEILGLAQLTTSESGRLKLLDFQLPDNGHAPSTHQAYTGNCRAAHLLCDVASLLKRNSVWPAHVETFLAELSSKREGVDCPTWAAKSLNELIDRPATLRWDDRLGLTCMAAMTGGLLYPIVLLVFSGWILRFSNIDVSLRFSLLLLFGLLLPAFPGIFIRKPLLYQWLQIDVRRFDDRPAERWRCVLRAILSWSPWTVAWVLFLFVSVMGVIVLRGEDPGLDSLSIMQLSTKIVCYLTSVLLLITQTVIGILSICFPSRGVVDRLVGTRLIYE